MNNSLLLHLSLALAFALVLFPVIKAAELNLEKGDRICLVGNALGERMQHQNYWETLLYQRFPDLDLTVRNLCFPGDEPLHRLRSLNFDPAWPWWKKLGDYAHHLAMPLLCSSYTTFAALSRFMRTSMLENARQDYVRTARAKGLRERVVILKHILRNSLIPIVTILAGILPALIGGSVIIETIFSIPGLGFLSYQAVLARDYPVVMALFAVTSLLTLVGILIADLGLAVVDPRISFGRGRA